MLEILGFSLLAFAVGTAIGFVAGHARGYAKGRAFGIRLGVAYLASRNVGRPE